jgi:hypothetical protein
VLLAAGVSLSLRVPANKKSKQEYGYDNEARETYGPMFAGAQKLMDSTCMCLLLRLQT